MWILVIILASVGPYPGDYSLAEAKSKTIMIPMESFSLRANSVHHDTTGQFQLGGAFAFALKQVE